MAHLTIDLADRSYSIHIASKLLNDQKILTDAIHGKNVLIVSNEKVAPLYMQKVISLLSDYNCAQVILPDGEVYKNLTTLNLIFDSLLENRFDRHCTLIALGGGVIGDMTGFAAASYQRGVNFIQIPTTLLAQVDSSVGGKTGINHALGKNMIGAFYQPKVVIADIDTLDSLSDRELKAGLAEVIKYGLLIDKAFFDWLQQNMDKLLARDKPALIYAIERCCQIKADIVVADERERGQRALLNLGHTFGHAIETGMGYGNWLHGEAVAAGMCMAANLSERIGWIDSNRHQQCVDIIASAGLPTTPPTELSTKRFAELMAHDKKVRDNILNLILFKDIGTTVMTSDYPHAELLACIDSYKSL